MEVLLHADFMKDLERFKACEAYWQQLIDCACAETLTLGQWHRYIPRFHPNGQPFSLEDIEVHSQIVADGRSYATNRAFRVMQYIPEDGVAGVSAWVEDYRTGYPPNWPVAELFISLCLSTRTAGVAKRLLVRWMDPTCGIEGMRAHVTQLTGGDGK